MHHLITVPNLRSHHLSLPAPPFTPDCFTNSFRPVSAADYVCVCILGRFGSEFAVAKQRGRHLLHPHWRPWSVNGRRGVRVFVQVAFRQLPTAGRHPSRLLVIETPG